MSDKNYCGAKKRDGSGDTCRLPAGWGTGRNYGPCKLHGGAAAKANLKHGYYSKYSTNRLADTIDKLAGDEDLLDLRQTAAALQALIFDVMNRLETGELEFDAQMAQTLSGIADKLSRCIERYHKITEGEKYVLQVEEVQKVVEQVVIIVREEVRDPATVERIGNRLQGVQW